MEGKKKNETSGQYFQRIAIQNKVEIDHLRLALEQANLMHKQPEEDSVDYFERIAEWFHRETGIMAPGKSAAPESYPPPYEERSKAWEAWHEQKNEELRNALKGGDNVEPE